MKGVVKIRLQDGERILVPEDMNPFELAMGMDDITNHSKKKRVVW